MTLCSACGCHTPPNEPEHTCHICRITCCGGCMGDDGLCALCHDIEEERWAYTE